MLSEAFCRRYFLIPLYSKIRPQVLGLFAIECVNQAMVRDPVFANECTGQGSHQANPSAKHIPCQLRLRETIRPGSWVFSLNFPGGASCHVHVAFARCCSRKNPGANDGLKRAPRRVVVDNPKLFWDLDFRQVWVDPDPRVESIDKIFHGEVMVKADDLLRKQRGSHLLDQGPIMSLARLGRGNPVRHIQGCQFPDNASLDPADEAVLSPQNQIHTGLASTDVLGTSCEGNCRCLQSSSRAAHRNLAVRDGDRARGTCAHSL